MRYNVIGSDEPVCCRKVVDMAVITPDIDLADIYERYAAGETLRGLAQSLGISTSHLSAKMKADGFAIRSRGGAGRLPDAVVDALHRRHMAGETLASIAREQSCNLTNIHALFKRRGLPTRS